MKRKHRCLQNTYCAGSIPARASRRGGRAVECTGLENLHGGNVIASSNLALSAMRIQPVVIAVIRQGNKYLLTRRVDFDPEEKQYAPYVWNLPGGGIQFGENPEKAIIREMKEELGVRIEITGLLPKVFSETRNGWQGIFICYLTALKEDEKKIALNEEADQYGWFTSDEVAELKILPLADTICREADKINSR